MAAGLCSDWRVTEGLTAMVSNAMFDATFQGLQPAPPSLPFGLLPDASFSSLDAIANHLPILDHLAFDDGDSLLAMQDPLDIDLFSCLLPCHPGASAAHDQLEYSYSTTDPSNAISGAGDPFGAGGLIYGPSVASFSPPLEVDVAAAMQLQTPVTSVDVAAPTAGFAFENGETTTKAAPAGSDGAGDAASGGSPSSHSIAARQRRRRISEKTLELGRLIPGGGRMNTAEMLQAAFKYVKFLQAQIGMLDVMGSSDQEELLRLDGRTPTARGTSQAEQVLLQVLLASPAVQEKLAAEGRCVVPTRLLHALADGDGGIKATRSSISTDLGELMASMR